MKVQSHLLTPLLVLLSLLPPPSSTQFGLPHFFLRGFRPFFGRNRRPNRRPTTALLLRGPITGPPLSYLQPQNYLTTAPSYRPIINTRPISYSSTIPSTPNGYHIPNLGFGEPKPQTVIAPQRQHTSIPSHKSLNQFQHHPVTFINDNSIVGLRPPPSFNHQQTTPRHKNNFQFQQSNLQQPTHSSNNFQQPAHPTNNFQQPTHSSNNFQQPAHPTNNFQQPAHSNHFQQPTHSSNNSQQPAHSNHFQQPTHSSNNFQQPGHSSNNFQQPGHPSSTFQPPPIQFNQFKPIINSGHGGSSHQSNTFHQSSHQDNSFRPVQNQINTFHQSNTVQQATQQPAHQTNSFQQSQHQTISFQQPQHQTNSIQHQANSFQQSPHQANSFQQDPNKANSFQQDPHQTNSFQQTQHQVNQHISLQTNAFQPISNSIQNNPLPGSFQSNVHHVEPTFEQIQAPHQQSDVFQVDFTEVPSNQHSSDLNKNHITSSLQSNSLNPLAINKVPPVNAGVLPLAHEQPLQLEVFPPFNTG